MASAERERLQRGKVLIVGAGGLGAPAALSLAAAGVGTIGLVDSDTVDLSNLHRQVIYRSADLGRPKVIAAAERIAARHPEVKVEPVQTRLSPANLHEIFRGYDFVIDATDQIASKYLVNDGAVLHHKPFSHAGVAGFQGQTMTVLPGDSACFRCLFPVPPPAEEVPACQDAGIIGAFAGAIGFVQAGEAVKYLLGRATLLTNRLLTFDAAAGRWRTVLLARNPQCVLCGEAPTLTHLECVDGGNPVQGEQC